MSLMRQRTIADSTDRRDRRGLLSGSVLRLWSNCHGQWDATAGEHEQIRSYLAVWGEEPATEEIFAVLQSRRELMRHL